MIGSRLLSLLLLAGCAFGSAHAQQADAQAGVPKVVVPSSVELRFGDPIYLPIGFHNASDQPVSAPSFSIHDPPLRYRVQAGSFESASHGYGESMAGGRTHMLPAHSMETTVMLINIWTPETGIQIAGDMSPTLHLEFFPKNWSQAECVVKADVKLRIAGSALNATGKRMLLDRARRLLADPDLNYWARNVYGGRPGGCAFSLGQSPLAWLDLKGKSRDAWYDPDSELYRRALSYVERDTALFRTLRFQELIDTMRGALHRFETGQDALSEYLALLDKCDASERFYHLLSLHKVTEPGQLDRDHTPNVTWPQIGAAAGRRYPASSYYLEKDTYSKVVILP